MTGRIKSFCTRHYGFITTDGIDYRFTYKEWKLRLPPIKGLKVEFEPKETEKGFQAINIRNIS